MLFHGFQYCGYVGFPAVAFYGILHGFDRYVVGRLPDGSFFGTPKNLPEGTGNLAVKTAGRTIESRTKITAFRISPNVNDRLYTRRGC